MIRPSNSFIFLVCVCMCMAHVLDVPEVGVWCFTQWLSALSFEIGCLPELGARLAG